jgi:hypothetical protein
MKKITLSILLLLVISFSGFAQSYDEIIKQNLTFNLVQNEITGVIVLKRAVLLRSRSRYKKVIWTLTTEDFGKTTAADILKDPEFGTIFKDKSDLTSVAVLMLRLTLILSF